MKHLCLIPAVGAMVALMAPGLKAAAVYGQTNLSSDISGMANNLDPNLKNPWGMSFSATSPFWVSNQRSHNSTLYNAQGVAQSLIVGIPTTATGPQGPTGQVFANITGNFLDNGTPALFIFDTLAGTIDAWNGSNGTTAAQMAATTGAVYTGLALGTNAGNNMLYAANFASGHIDVYNSAFAPATVGGTFTDATVPAGYAPYNIQNVGGNLYVEYAQQGVGGAVPGPGKGFVRVFDTNGNLLAGAPAISGGSLNAPWGVTMAPSGFGDFSNDLLVGNFGDGTINVFNPLTGAFVGTISDNSGKPIVNSGLWALGVRTGGNFNLNAVYLTAGINNEADGLFAVIQVVPEPASTLLVGMGLALAAIFIRTSKRKRG